MPDNDLIARVCRFADARHAPATPFETGVEGLTLVRSRAPSALEGMIYAPLLCLVLQGSKETYLGQSPVRFAAGQSLIVSLDVPSIARIVEASVETPYVALALRLDLGVIRDLQAEVPEADVADGPAQAIVASASEAPLVDAMRRLFDLVERPRERRVLLPLLRREIHFRLLLAPHGAMLRRLAHRDSHASRIGRALSRIRMHFVEPLKVAELADLAGMSPSSFHAHFKSMTATTPLQYQKDLRLLEARRRLIDGGQTVSGVAFGVGYESPTQFSREYARKFGAAPRDHRIAV